MCARSPIVYEVLYWVDAQYQSVLYDTLDEVKVDVDIYEDGYAGTGIVEICFYDAGFCPDPDDEDYE